METTSKTYEIPAYKLGKVQGAIEALNKRARRLHLPEITVKVTAAYVKDIEVEVSRASEVVNGKGIIREPYNTIEVTGVSPKLNGWEFAATFEHDPETSLTILRKSEAFEHEIPTAYRKASAVCDHCKLARRRNDTYLCYCAETAQFKQIGRNCLKDFLGHADPHSIAAAAELWSELGEIIFSDDECESWGSGRGEIVLETEHFIKRAFAVVRVKGFVSRAKAKEAQECGDYSKQATADLITTLIFPTTAQRLEKWWKELDAATQVTAQDEQNAAAAIEWAQGFDPENCNDYQHNLLVVCSATLLPSRRFGLAASVPSTYLRHLDKLEEQRKRLAGRKPSEFVGTVGERLTGLKLTLLRVIMIPGETFGNSYLHKFEDEDGNQFVWFSSGAQWTEGGTFEVTGTVKQHNDSDKWGKSTTLSRCKGTARLDDAVPGDAIGTIDGTHYVTASDYALTAVSLIDGSHAFQARTLEEFKSHLTKKQVITWAPGATWNHTAQVEGKGYYNVTYSDTVARFEAEVRPLFEALPSVEGIKCAAVGVVHGEVQPDGSVLRLFKTIGETLHVERVIAHKLENAPAKVKTPRKAKKPAGGAIRELATLSV